MGRARVAPYTLFYFCAKAKVSALLRQTVLTPSLRSPAGRLRLWRRWAGGIGGTGSDLAVESQTGPLSCVPSLPLPDLLPTPYRSASLRPRERQFVLRQDETYFKDSWTACRSISCLGWASGNITDPLQLRLVASHLLGCVSWLLWSANGWGGFNGVSDLSSRSNAAAEGYIRSQGFLDEKGR